MTTTSSTSWPTTTRLPPAYGAHLGAHDRRVPLRRPVRGRSAAPARTRPTPRPGRSRARAEAIDEDGARRAASGSPASMLVWDASARADLLDARTAELGGRPDLRRAGQPGRLHAQARGPGRRGRRGDGRPSSRASADYFDELAERHREGVASGRTPADFAVAADGRSSSTPGSPTPIGDDPMLGACRTRPPGVDAAALARAAAAPSCEKQVRPGGRALPRRAPRRGGARRPGPTSGAG